MRGKTYSIRRRIVVITIIPLIVLFFMLLAFYQLYSTNTLKQAESAFSSLAWENEEQIENLFESIRMTAQSAAYSHAVQNFLFTATPSERVYDHAAVKAHIEAIVEDIDGISLLLVETADGKFIYWGKGYTWLKQLDTISEQTINTNGHSFAIFPEKQQCLFHFQMRPVLTAAPFSSIMHTYVLFDMNRLIPANSSENGVLQALVYQDRLMACSAELTDAERAQLQEISRNSGATSFGNVRHYIFSHPLSSDNQLYFVMLQPVSALTGRLTTFWHISLSAFGAISLMLMALMFVLLKNISYPISLIVRDMSSIPISARSVSLTNVDELNAIASGANYMLAQLRQMQTNELETQKQYYRAALEKSRAENIAYRSQINPHFLFNTLECIAGMAEYYNVRPMGELITALSTCFRYSLRAPDIVPLTSELEHLQRYMDIMMIRFPGKFHVRQKIAPAAANAQIPSLLLQPLAENAVLHGFRNTPSDRAWIVHISIQTDQQRLRIVFTDNGSGIAPDILTALQTQIKSDASISKEHIGLRNIWKRLTLHYKDACDFRITSRPGHYTRMEIIMPLMIPENLEV